MLPIDHVAYYWFGVGVQNHEVLLIVLIIQM